MCKSDVHLHVFSDQCRHSRLALYRPADWRVGSETRRCSSIHIADRVDHSERCTFVYRGVSMRHKSVRALLLAGAVGALLTIAGRAQAQSVITGRVTNEQGAPIGGATVRISEFNIGINTTSSGTFSLPVPANRVQGQSVILTVRSI